MQQLAAEQQPHRHQHRTQHTPGNQGRINGAFHVPVLFSAEQLGNDHRAADVAPKRKRDKDQGDLIAVSHRGQRVFADKFTGNEAVCQII